jgi:PKD repeat protein
MRAFIVLIAAGFLLLPVHLPAQCNGCEDHATLTGSAGSYYGYSVAVIGDINEDGIADFIIGAPNGPDHFGNPNNVGKAWILSGADPEETLKYFAGWYDLDLPNGRLGFCVSGAGDVNGDGTPDVIIGEPNWRQQGSEWLPTGRAHVYSGDMDAHPDNLYFPILLEHERYRVGWCVACAGDVNNDGRDDVIVGAPKDSTGYLVGHAFVYAYVDNGGNDEWTELYHMYGTTSYQTFGKTVSGAGDVNKDGHDDFMIYSKYLDGKGAVYVYSGIDGEVLHTLIGDIPNGYFGTRMAPLGLIDDDAYDDFIIANNVGSVYLYSGHTGTLLYTFDTGTPTNPTFGDDIASAGDFDNDGKMDILIGFSAYSRLCVYSGETYQWLDNIDGTGDHCGAAVAGPLAILSDGYNVTVAGSPNSNSVSVFACGYPEVDFEGEPLSGYVPLTVSFTDLSSPDITAWSWSFGDGGTSTDENPVHEYTEVGTFTVSLTATGFNCDGTETKVDYITVEYGPPVADFIGEPLSGTVPLEVSFTNLSDVRRRRFHLRRGQHNSYLHLAGDVHRVSQRARPRRGKRRGGETRLYHRSAFARPRADGASRRHRDKRRLGLRGLALRTQQDVRGLGRQRSQLRVS